MIVTSTPAGGGSQASSTLPPVGQPPCDLDREIIEGTAWLGILAGGGIGFRLAGPPGAGAGAFIGGIAGALWGYYLSITERQKCEQRQGRR